MTRYVVVKPGAEPGFEDIGDDFREIQKVIGGHFEGWSFGEELALFVHGDGRMLGLPLNFVHPRLGDIVGVAVITRADANGTEIDSTDADLALVKRVVSEGRR